MNRRQTPLPAQPSTGNRKIRFLEMRPYCSRSWPGAVRPAPDLPDLVKDAHGQGVGLDDLYKSLPTQTIL